ncbi:hypothetical protein BJV77DRAFT_961606 [Russula vinacea]|nr:hypothetical protein BJV77DRAFT_961606 [Russula vinacea]
MSENTASNDTRPSTAPSTRRLVAANTPIRVRGVAPDPVIAAPNAPRAAVLPSRILIFFGYGRNNRARKELVSLITSLVVDAAQIIAIITFLTISTHRRSPTILSETSGMRVGNHWALGTPFGSSVFPRYLAQSLALVPNGHVPNDAETQPRNRPSAAPRVEGHRSLLSKNTTATATAKGNRPPGNAVPEDLRQILLYSSANTCRRSSPHLWWLTFGVLSVMYVMILEVVLVAILVFVVGPILFLFWSILLLCLGRHPSQNPHHFTPDIGQVPRTVVDKLPLVIYIPPPPDQPSKPVTLPSDLHTYPPKSAASRRILFLPFRRRAHPPRHSKGWRGKEKGSSNRLPTWEDNWEKASSHLYSSTVTARRALFACSTFKNQNARAWAPWDRKSQRNGGNQAVDVPGTREEGEGDITEQAAPPASPTSPSSGMALRLRDAGEGAQPLRLLKCGHVFHKTCVDPWLLDVSGRCPVCQRPVREQADATGTGQDARPERRRWFRRTGGEDLHEGV